MESSTSSALAGSVSSLRSSMHLLDSSISILDSGVADYPRLARVLQRTRHFELVSEPSLLAAQEGLLSEIQPEVDTLLGRVETYLDRLERREKGLIAKAELQEGRLRGSSYAGGSSSGARGSASATSGASGTKDAVGGADGKALSAQEEMKMQQMRQKKERLSYAVSRLELQAGQRERQLRKSMAAQ
ncbi:DASH complex subunit spc19 [Saxophila tyrrhenica]|uniref:DASH complex subunit SPC19 n=1 Tax=Saxophila tyrrhenica TaxID=1690608 RepID=A0AAV9NVH3_9PEZI|nr:DASH complex subunit spc19 [Saxophila tyrrhenica]